MATSKPDLEALVARYRQTGDVELLGELFDRAAPRLFRLAVAVLQDATLAEDALQDAFLDAFRHLERYDETYAVMPWLTGILQRSARKLARKARRRPDPARLETRRRSTAAQPLADEDRALLDAALATLEEPYRSVAVLHWRYGLTPAEIAHSRGQPPGTIRSLLSRARARLGMRNRAALPLVPLAAPRGLEAVRETLLAKLTATPAIAAMSMAGSLIMWKKPWFWAVLVLMLVGSTVATVAVVGSSSAEPGAAFDTLTPGGGRTEPVLHGRADAKRTAGEDTSSPTGPAITGTVGARVDAPVAGALVCAIPASTDSPIPAPSLAESASAASAHTDAAGAFRLALPSAGEVYTLIVTTEDGACGSKPGARAGDHVHITVVRPGRLAGDVLDLAGRPVADAALTLRVALDALDLTYHARSGDDGSYELTGIPVLATRAGAGIPWHATLVVEHADYAPLFLESRRWFGTRYLPRLTPGERSRMDLVLIRGAEVSGVVLEEDSDRPIPGARVVLWSKEGRNELYRRDRSTVAVEGHGRILAETTSDEEGAYAFHHVPARGFHELERPAVFGPGEPSDASPIGQLVAVKDGLIANHDVPRLANGVELFVRLRVWPTATVTGRALRSNGQAARGAAVWLRTRSRDGSSVLPSALADLPTNVTTTGPDGTFRVSMLRAAGRPPTQATLWVQHFVAFRDGTWSLSEARRIRLTLRDGEQRDLGDIQLPAVDSGPHLDVRIVNRGGNPIPGAEAFSWRDPQTQRADAAGRLRLYVGGVWSKDATLPPLQARVSATGYATTYVQARPWFADGPAVTVTLAPGRTLAGEVVDADGQAVGGAQVTVAPPTAPGSGEATDEVETAPLAEVIADDAGRFRVPDLPAGPLRVTAAVIMGREQREVAAALTRVDPGEGGVRIELPEVVATNTPEPPGSSPAVLIPIREKGTNRPVAMATGVLEAADGFAYTGTMMRPGVLRFLRPRDHTYVLKIRAQGYLPADIPDVRTVGGQLERPLEVTLDRGAVVRGRVTWRGKPVRNLTLHLDPETPPFTGADAVIRSDGTYEVSGLARGRYRIRCFQIVGSGEELPPFLSTDDTRLVIDRDVPEQRFDVALAPAGELSVRVPPAEGEVRPRLVVIDGSGRRIEDREVPKAIYGGWTWRRTVLPGPYTAQLHLPDGTIREAIGRVEVGMTVTLTSFD